MKCPKCGYLGFESVDRCRNCGYEFSLTDGTDGLELPIRTAPPTIDPLADLAMVDAAGRSRPTPAAVPQSELPLFGFPPAADESPIARPSPPRPPRRRPDEAHAQSLNLDLDPPVAQFAAERDGPFRAPGWASLESAPADAALFARLVAVMIDLTILAAIDAVVIYFTLQICGITLADFDILPKGPLLAFLLVQNGGYLIAFTAGGQTLGKMLTGIKVVSAGTESSLDLGHATLRTLLWVLLAVPMGLGFLTALLSSDRRGLHDRFAHTRVVRG